MARVWQTNDEHGWVAIEIVDAAVFAAGTIAIADPCSACRPRAHIVHTSEGSWVLTAPPDLGVTINGRPLKNGLRVLQDRDSIRVPGSSTCFFSTERLAAVEPLPILEEIYCPRCKLPIEQDGPAVCCPSCGVWHHEQAAPDAGRELLCWTYTDTCALCDQATDLDAAQFRWTPGSL